MMSEDVKLRVVCTSDLHANVFPYDYYRDRADDTVGLARTATLIASALAEAPNAVLVDNGDFLQGAPLGDWAAQAFAGDPRNPHPMIAAMNALGYAAGALGNHEFNYGLELLEAAVRQANFPILSCNILKPDGGFYFRPWVVLDRTVRDEAGAERRLRIGVIGFTTPQIVQWDQAHLLGRASTIGIAEAARDHVPQLRAAGADIVIALCHSGIAHGPEGLPGEENAALALSRVPGIDALVLGHQHLMLPGADFAGIPGVDVLCGALNGVPAVMPGFWGSHAGVIDLSLSETDSGWKVAGFHAELRPIYERQGEAILPMTTSAPAPLEAAREGHEATLAYVRAPVGQIASPINSYFALIAPDPSVQTVNAAQLWYARKLTATEPALAGLPLLSASAPFKCGGRGGPDYYTDVPAGPVAIKNVADLYVYPNGLRVVKVTGGGLREWLERSASLFHQIDPASTEPQPLIDPTFAAYNFDVIDGVSYEIDAMQPARYDNEGRLVAPNSHRVQDLRYAGQPVDPAASFLVVTNSYRAGGGGNFPGVDASSVVYEAPDSNRDALVRYILENRRVEPRSEANWRFAPWPETALVTYLCSPAAAGAPQPASVRLTLLGPAPGGFASYRVQPL